MKSSTEKYLIDNRLDNDEGIKELKLYLRLDMEIPTKEVNAMSIDEIVEKVIQDHRDNPITGS